MKTNRGFPKRFSSLPLSYFGLVLVHFSWKTTNVVDVVQESMSFHAPYQSILLVSGFTKIVNVRKHLQLYNYNSALLSDIKVEYNSPRGTEKEKKNKIRFYVHFWQLSPDKILVTEICYANSQVIIRNLEQIWYIIGSQFLKRK